MLVVYRASNGSPTASVCSVIDLAFRNPAGRYGKSLNDAFKLLNSLGKYQVRLGFERIRKFPENPVEEPPDQGGYRSALELVGDRKMDF